MYQWVVHNLAAQHIRIFTVSIWVNHLSYISKGLVKLKNSQEIIPKKVSKHYMLDNTDFNFSKYVISNH